MRSLPRLLPVFLIVPLLLLQRRADAGTSGFVPSQAEAAVQEPGSSHAAFSVEPGRSYPFLKRGGPGGAWCKLASPGGGGAGWVLCEHGALGGMAASAAPAQAPVKPRPDRTGRVGAQSCSSTCSHPPLFPVEPPMMGPAREVLDMCPTHPEASVREGDVRRFFAAHIADMRLQRALSQAGRTSNREANVDWLTKLWVGSGPRNAFTHVFCGDDWTQPALGGLHFLPRYVQLEKEGKLCFDGPVGTGDHPEGGAAYGIRFHALAPWSCAVKHRGGFTQGKDPIELVALATRAFVQCCDRSRHSPDDGGVFHAREVGGTSFQIFCGTRNGTYGIATFYPTDAPPTCGDR